MSSAYFYIFSLYLAVLLSSFVDWWFSLVVCIYSFLFIFWVFTAGFCLVVTVRHPYKSLYLKRSILSWWQLKFDPTLGLNNITLPLHVLCVGFVCLSVFCLFRAMPMTYGDFQARGPIGAVATGLHHNHSNAGSEPCLWPTPQVTATTDC